MSRDASIPSAEALVARLKELPALPEVVADLIASLADDDINSTRIARIIQSDPALTGNTLHLANSPFFGMRGSINSIKDAITVLGLRSVRSMALASSISVVMRVSDSAIHDIRNFWRNAYETAAASRALAPTDQTSQNHALLGGLLHDIGILALAVLRPDLCAAIHAHAIEHRCSWTVAEESLGIPHHGHIGGILAGRWNFPVPLCQIIALHHTPASEGGAIAAAVHIADVMAHAAETLRGSSYRPPVIDATAWQLLKPTPTALLAAARAIRDSSSMAPGN
jgi:HD-like signal output (HDOD) protein